MKTESERRLDGLDEQIVLAERRRQRVFRRWVLGVAVCLMALVAVRLGWGIYATRQLAAEIEGIRAAGEPIYPSDFNPAHEIPDAENAAVLYQAAATAIVRPANSVLSFDDFRDDLRFCDKYPSEARAVFRSNEETLRLLRDARSRDKVDWGLRFERPLIELSLPQLRPNSELARLARSAAYICFRDEDHFEAIATIRDIHGLAANLMGTPRTTLITHLIAVGCEAYGIEVLEEITSGLSVSDESTTPRSLGLPATRSQIQILMGELLDEELSWWGLRHAMYSQRATELDAMQAFLADEFDMHKLIHAGIIWKPFFGPLRGWMRPAFELDAEFTLRNTSLIADGASNRSWPNAFQILKCARHPHLQRQVSTMVESAPHIVSVILYPSFERAILHSMRSICMRRMAAIALAVRLYELDHGLRPDGLADLVPDYINAIPTDPFSAQARPLGYRPRMDPAVIYSVGVDGVDDGGAFALTLDDSVDWERKDMVYFLNGGRPREPLATPTGDLASEQAEEDDRQKQIGQWDSYQREDPDDHP